MGVSVTTATALLLLLLIFSSSSSSSAQGQNSRSTSSSTTVTISHSGLTNTVPIQIGKPVQKLSVGLDTSSDVTLLPCNTLRNSTYRTTVNCKDDLCNLVPNSGCISKTNRTCFFSTKYGDSTVFALLMQDRIFLNNDIIKNYTFGCVFKSTGTSFPKREGAAGFLGLGRGKLSLLYQSNTTYNSTFSYCLPSLLSTTSTTGSLKLGPDGQPRNIHTTPLLQSLRRPSFYFAQLLNISVDGTPLPQLANGKALAFNSSAAAGTAIDAGIVFTSLVRPVYKALTHELHQRMHGRPIFKMGPFDNCYSSEFNLTSITFKFKFMDLKLTKQNFIFKLANSATRCLAMVPAPDDSVNRNLNIIGSFQLQNKQVLISEPLKTLRIADC